MFVAASEIRDDINPFSSAVKAGKSMQYQAKLSVIETKIMAPGSSALRLSSLCYRKLTKPFFWPNFV
jgi:hypothetical protein